MEKTLTKKPAEKPKGTSGAGAFKKPVSALKRAAAATASHASKYAKDRLSKKSATAQAVKKLAPEKSETSTSAAARERETSRSVNYLSSTTASRAKAAPLGQIHKPSTALSTGKLAIGSSSIKSDASFKTRRPKSATNNKELEDQGRDKSLSSRGKSRSQATIKSATQSQVKKSPHYSHFYYSSAPNKDAKKEKRSGSFISAEEEDQDGNTVAGLAAGLTSGSSNDDSMSGKRKGIHGKGGAMRFWTNRTTELRAALHRPTTKASSTKSDASRVSRKSYKKDSNRDGKSKKRPRKRASSASAATKKQEKSNSGRNSPSSLLRA